MTEPDRPSYSLNSDVLKERINGLHQKLLASCEAGSGLTSATKGGEREALVDELLSRVFTSPMRFGTGDIIDSKGHRSGQLDIVLENQSAMSFPMTDAGPRLYLAENVAAAIEVKSDLNRQWSDVVTTAQQLRALQPASNREFWERANRQADAKAHGWEQMKETAATNLAKSNSPRKIPLFVVGFAGWQTSETYTNHLADEGCDDIAGILALNPLKLALRSGVILEDEFALLAFLNRVQGAFERFEPLVMGAVNWYV